LKHFLPNLKETGEHFLSYVYVEGVTLYKENKKDAYLAFLNWFETHCLKTSYTEAEISDLTPYAISFYKEKTLNRLNAFKTSCSFEELDAVTSVNGISVKSVDSYLQMIPWETLYQTMPSRLFHGDLQFDNVLYNNNTFTLIDWREDFGGNTEFGDVCYDLAKLYGGMELNYNVMKDPSAFHVTIEGKAAHLDHFKDETLKDIQQNEFPTLLEKYSVPVDKVKLLVAIIFLNMAPLHINNFDKLLFLKSKLLFEESLKG
jgi:thiamine kinase-like enzyme